MKRPDIHKENVEALYETKFLKLYDLNYAQGKHYFVATRNDKDNLVAVKTDSEFKNMVSDAVTCIVIIMEKGKESRLLMNYEYRYPAGQFLLSPPAGLIDPEDKGGEKPEIQAAIREIKEETGLTIKDSDTVKTVSPLSFSTPGMTDESNALVLAVINVDNLSELNQEGAVGSEMFDGFRLLNKEEARKVLSDARDEYGNYFSIYTWAALMYFVSDMWKN